MATIWMRIRRIVRRGRQPAEVDPMERLAQAIRAQREAVVGAHRAVGNLRVDRRRLELYVERENERIARAVGAVADATNDAQRSVEQRAQAAVDAANQRRRQLLDDLAEVMDHENRLETNLVKVEDRLQMVQRQYRMISAKNSAASATEAVGDTMTATAQAENALVVADEDIAQGLRDVARELEQLHAKQEALAELAQDKHDEDEEFAALMRRDGASDAGT